MKKYNPQKIEKKWQKVWPHYAEASQGKGKKEKFYALVEFPYPSGDGLHVGHCRSYTGLDIISRKKRMEGKNVLFPMGWDAFGLPTENYAIKKGVHPSVITKKNTDTFRKQLKSLGFSFDWSREINTTDPAYYKWTQWIFLQLFKNGLAYKDKIAINWCPSCKIGLANEEVVAGNCERCGTKVEKREKEQWLIKITKYAERLIKDLDNVNYLEKIKVQQKEWIGRSEGINIDYKIEGQDKIISIFTTRPDTNFGATFLVAGPDSNFVKENLELFPKKEGVKKYIKEALAKSDIDRTAEGRRKTGVDTGWYAINNLNNRKMSIYVGDFVLGQFGTGCVVGVPGHDLRDFEFAKAMGLEIIRVVVGKDGDTSEITDAKQVQEEEGKMINSGFLDGKDIHDATNLIMNYIEQKGWGKKIVNYKLRDWVFSRQHYWGEPIPLVYCENCSKIKPKILLIHGLYGYPEKNWYMWFKEQAEKRGYEVLVPKMPNADKPKFKEWLKILENLKLGKDEQVYVIGHSLGAVTACQFIIKNKIKVKKLVLVAPVAKSQNKYNFDNLEKDGCSSEALICIKEFIKENKGLGKLKKLAEESVIYLSDNDPFVPLSAEKDYADLKANIKILKTAGHFNQTTTGKKDFPDILLDFPENKNNGWVAVTEKDLPVELPKIKNYKPTDTGESPLSAITKWVNTKCPKCGGPAKRETDTMPNWAGSNWYFLAYTFAKNPSASLGAGGKYNWNNKDIESFMPVNWYNGGMEHTTLHLLYSRFVFKFLWDIGAVPKSIGSEPYMKRTSHGMVLGEGGIKMSKSKGNVINPDQVVKEFGADTLRIYEMFMGPFDQAIPWDTKGVIGSRRFLERIYNLVIKFSISSLRGILSERSESKETKQSSLESLINKTIKKVSEDIEAMRFNTAVSALMILVNAFSDEVAKNPTSPRLRGASIKNLLLLLSPFAPHLAEELWQEMKFKGMCCQQPWPKYDEKLIVAEKVLLIVQINGKVRDKIEAAAGLSQADAEKLVNESEKIKQWLSGAQVKKIIYVKDKLINIVI